MKIGPAFLTFVYLSWAIFKILYTNETEETPTYIFPTIETPDIEFKDIDSGCSGFTDCIEFVGWVLYNIGAGIVFIVLFFINLLVFLFDLTALILQASIEGIDGAPWYFNLIINTIGGVVGSILIYKLVRRGDDSAG